MIGILSRYNTMKCHLQPMSGTLLGTCHKMSGIVQKMFQGMLLTTKCQLLQSINVLFLETLGTSLSDSRYT